MLPSTMLLFSLLIGVVYGGYTPDIVSSLPGQNFTPSFIHYSGFLQASSTRYLHYWLTESIRTPETAPLILWLSGGPGCSALGNLLRENGPFHLSNYGNTVYFNKWTWNNFANVLYVEAPAGVGYSYTTDGNLATDDDLASLNNYNSLLSFLQKFPEYQDRDLYITGESYAGIFLSTLGVRLKNDPTNFPNFKGIAVGNGYMDIALNQNTLIPIYYYHALIRDELYTRIRDQCCNGTMEICDISRNMTQNCTNWVNEALAAGDQLNIMNLYDTCYLDGSGNTVPGKLSYIKTSHYTRMGFQSTGNSAADVPLCAQTDNTYDYLNRADVRKALHIPSSLPSWCDCCDNVGSRYTTIYQNMYQQVQNLNAAGIRILMFNGDVDTLCSHMMNMKFVTNLNRQILGPELANLPWTYKGEAPNVAGFMTQYTLNLDYLTVRGAGHLSPGDKPREVLQMLYNWINGNDYSKPDPFS